MLIGLRRAARIVALQSLPAFIVFMLKYLFFQRIASWANGHARLEHERERVCDLAWREFGVAGALKGFGIRAVAGHAVMQARSAGQKALGLGIVFAVNQAHELVHHVAMEPG